jgi:hypothetical protein
MKNSHSEQHPYNFSSDYTVLIHHKAPDRHVKRYNYKGRQYLCDSHNFATHTRPFGLPCSEALSTHTRLANFNLSVLHIPRLCLHILGSNARRMQTLICFPPIITWGSITKNFLGDCTCKGEHNSLEFWLGIFLSYATVVYLILAQGRIHTMTSNVNMHDMIWFLHRRGWSPSSLWRDLHPSTSTGSIPRHPLIVCVKH